MEPPAVELSAVELPAVELSTTGVLFDVDLSEVDLSVGTLFTVEKSKHDKDCRKSFMVANE